jgi:hypothetical protein
MKQKIEKLETKIIHILFAPFRNEKLMLATVVILLLSFFVASII